MTRVWKNLDRNKAIDAKDAEAHVSRVWMTMPFFFSEVVRSEAKQIGIIESIFRNFYIPSVTFAVNSSGDGSETKTCIDGKQMLTSIHK